MRLSPTVTIILFILYNILGGATLGKLNTSISNIELKTNKVTQGSVLAESNSADYYVSAKSFNEAVNNLLNSIFPVGYILTTFDSGDYSDYLGFRWEKMENTFLFADGSKSLGSVGGTENQTLTVAQLPNVGGSFAVPVIGMHGTYGVRGYATATNFGIVGTDLPTGMDGTVMTAGKTQYGYGFNFGSNQPHNNMPPYTVVRMWRRLS